VNARRWPLIALSAALLLSAPPAAAEGVGTAPEASPRGDYPALQALEREIAKLVQAARPSVVSVVTRSRIEILLKGLGDNVRFQGSPSTGALARRVGSGVVFDAEGHVATVSSVVAGATDIVVIAHDGRKLPARLLGVDTPSGLAVLAVDDSRSLRPARMGDGARLDAGSLVTTFGTDPSGGPTYSVGFVSGTGVSQGPFRRGPYLKLDAYTAPGSGGGPVFDSRGDLVGLVFGASGLPSKDKDTVIRWEAIGTPGTGEESSAEAAYFKALHRAGSIGAGVSYAVPIDVVRHVADQIISSGSVRRAWLGVTIESPEPGEVHLTRVVPDSPAARAGLAVGDRIVSVDDEPLSVAEALVEKIAVSPPDTVVNLGVIRDDRMLRFPVKLGEKEEPKRLAFEAQSALLHLMTPRLGIRLEEVGEDVRKELGAPSGDGVMVVEVEEDARGAVAGLRPGDLIIAAEDGPVRSIRDLRRALREQDPGDSMKIDVIRLGKRLALLVPPPEPPPAPPAPPAPPRAPRKPRDQR